MAEILVSCHRLAIALSRSSAQSSKRANSLIVLSARSLALHFKAPSLLEGIIQLSVHANGVSKQKMMQRKTAHELMSSLQLTNSSKRSVRPGRDLWSFASGERSGG
jgi:hypothetical protein